MLDKLSKQAEIKLGDYRFSWSFFWDNFYFSDKFLNSNVFFQILEKMRSAKIGVARQIERQAKPSSGGRKISTSSRGTVNSLHSQPDHHPSNSQVYTRYEK